MLQEESRRMKENFNNVAKDMVCSSSVLGCRVGLLSLFSFHDETHKLFNPILEFSAI